MGTVHLHGQASNPPLTRIPSLSTGRKFFLESARQTLKCSSFGGLRSANLEGAFGQWIFNLKTYALALALPGLVQWVAVSH